MLAYAADRRAHRRLSPAALTLIIGVHALALIGLATAKVGLPELPTIVRTKIFNVPPPPPPATPPPAPATAKVVVQPRVAPPSRLEVPRPLIDTPATGPAVDFGLAAADPAPDIGPALATPLIEPLTALAPAAPVRIGARAITPADLLRPPYPDTKRRSEEEAVLRLRLAIDARGRVIAVDPVGSADPAFLAAARTHLIRHWRYRPASEDGRAVSARLVITLRFELEDE